MHHEILAFIASISEPTFILLLTAALATRLIPAKASWNKGRMRTVLQKIVEYVGNKEVQPVGCSH